MMEGPSILPSGSAVRVLRIHGRRNQPLAPSGSESSRLAIDGDFLYEMGQSSDVQLYSENHFLLCPITELILI